MIRARLLFVKNSRESFSSVISCVSLFLISLGKQTLSRAVVICLLTSMFLHGIILDPIMVVTAETAGKPSLHAAPPEPFTIFSEDPRHSSTLGRTHPTIFQSAIYALITTAFTSDPSSGENNKPYKKQELNTESRNLDAEIKEMETETTEFAKAVELRIEEDAPSPPQPAATVDFDFDGDGKSDLSRRHPSNSEFKIKNSNGGSYSTYTVGAATAKPASADYDGDGLTDAATFAAGTWTVRKSNGGTTSTISFGQAGDIPAAGNYYGGAADELAYFRPSDGTWYYREFANATVYSLSWGQSGDIPAAGDYDGDGKMDWTIYRPSTGVWWFRFNAGGYSACSWGVSIDIPVPADFDGDGKTDPTIYRPSTGAWWSLKSSTSYSTWAAQAWGNFGDQPVAGDFDGDGKADFAVWRPTTGVWYIIRSSNSSFQIETLGVPGDTAVPSAYLKQVGSEVAPDEIAKARLSPKNATGRTDLYSRNFSWGRSLLSLPGRSGLDLGLGINYNSLIWTKVGSTMLFDADIDNVSPGFRLGFPTIEPAYYDDDTGRYNYLLVTPSGSRLQFRATGVSNIYETVDSSYAQLVTTGTSSPNDPVENITIKVTTTDGTQMSYAWKEGAFRCTQVRDRNGNFISIAYNINGQLATVTDTLGRTVTIHYDNNGYPSAITQTWRADNGSGSTFTLTWATFSYATKTIATDFHPSLTVWGPPNGMDLRVLDKVTYSDSSSTKFYYNGYAQVYKIENHAPDSTTGSPHVLNQVRSNLDSIATDGTDESDCPRFGQTWNKVENFNSGNETTFINSLSTGQSYTSPAGGGAMTATKVEVLMSGHPHNAVSKTWYAESGWKEGLTLASEDWADGASGSERKRWTLTSYEQDDMSTGYPINPRVAETKVGDGVNTKRTLIAYDYLPMTNVAIFGLPATVYEYDSDQTTVIRQTNISYNLYGPYEGRHIVGLPDTVLSYGYNQHTNSLEMVSKTTYAYDEGNFSDSGLQQTISPVQHDTANYGPSFLIGRGNLTSTTRWDATQPTNGAAAITSSTKYNTAGSPVARVTPWDGSQTRTVRIGYSDNFNSTGNPTTYAYPTVMTDPDGSSLGDVTHSSPIKYRYDIGTNVEANSPAPTGQIHGKKSKRVFDSVGRLERESVYVNSIEKSYTRYEYPNNGVQSKAYSPIVDADGDGNMAEDEVYSESWFDGAGRPRQSRTEHPGSTGGWTSNFADYDILGRLKRQSVPTETNSSFAPAGDDSAGPLWTHFKYDWMGRVIRKIDTDGVDSPTLNDSDVLISYEGCGCAGGNVTTVKGPVTTAVDIAGVTQTTKRRTQKAYDDILGRTFKTESWDLDGAGPAPYSTVKTTFNGRDQATLIRQYSGSETSSTYQDTTATFDGHGRLKTQHRPEQDAGTVTTYNYNADDSVLSVVDARGASSNYVYNARGLVTQISYTSPNPAQIPVAPAANFSYDNIGNRTQMTDGLGTVTYAYDELSQMLSETRDFTDNLPNAPLVAGNQAFKLDYTYLLSGGLKSLKDPYGETIDYAHDKTGRLNTVTERLRAAVRQYMQAIHNTGHGALLKG